MNNIIKSGFPRIISRLVLAILLVGMSQFEAEASPSRLKQIGRLDVGSEKLMPTKESPVRKAVAQSDNGIAMTILCNEIYNDIYSQYTGIYLTDDDDYEWSWQYPDNIIFEDSQTVLNYANAYEYFYFRSYNDAPALEAIKIYLDPTRTNNASVRAAVGDFDSGSLYYSDTKIVADYANNILYWYPDAKYEYDNIFFYIESGEINVIGLEIYSEGNTPADFLPGSTVYAVTPPVFNPTSCNFTTPISIEILAEEGCDVYYRTDGYAPTVDDQYKYNGPIVISSTTTFKAIAADANGNTSRVVTSTYICTRHGIGEGYDPEPPGNPGGPGDAQEKTYKLTLVTNPSGAGSVSASSYNLKAGQQTYVSTYNNTGFVFKNWTIEDTEVSAVPGFYYVMPDYDVTIVANYVYDPASPGNPNPEEQKVKHPAVVRAIPSGAARVNPSGAFNMEENTSRQVYAYPNTGWKLVGWTVNGEQQSQTTSPLSITMGEKALDIAAYFSYDPASPSNPGANYYNPRSGQVIIDDFTPGNLYSALDNLVGYNNFSNVSSLMVKGVITSNDLGYISYLSNVETIDISRTGGVSVLPGYTFYSVGASSIVLPSTISSMDNYVFSNCTNLASLTIYAQEPPTCSYNTFNNFTNKANCTVYVPASAVELYSNADYWKDFTILPITNDAHVLQVNLPADAADGRYKHNSLEIVNINSGVRQKYVISDRLLYTFNGLQKDEQYNIYMFSPAGLEIGKIENVIIPDQDIEVTFDNLKSLHTVFAKVLSSDGSDVTSQVTVEWLKPLADGTTTYLRKAESLGEIPEGQQLICRVTLDNKLGVAYANPEDVEFTVSPDDNTCEINLVPFRAIELSGTVVDGDGAALSGASVSINQTLNGKYSKTFTAKTDRSGSWGASVLDAPETRLTYAANECVNVNDTIAAFDADVTSVVLGKITLKSIVGARVTYDFTYHAAGVEDVQDHYSDYQNVLISVYNVTQSREHKDVSLQYPILAVLDENINTGDELQLTAISKTGAFNSIVETVTVGENQRAEVTFDIVGKGGIAASFEMTDNPKVIAMLYSGKGELLKKTTYSEAQVTFTELEDGDYTLVSMGQSDLMNSILRLSNFDEIGLTEGKDYVKNSVKVESGKLTEIKISEVPAFDESLFYYTNSSTSFTANKSSLTTGNYLTLRSAIDFKGIYKDGISNVALVVDLPEACDFVEQSVIQGPNLLPYTLDNKRLTVPLGNNYQSQTRFCVVPTSGGTFNATASIVFDYNGKTVTQPIGSALSNVDDITISAAPVINAPSITISGKATPQSIIRIYWNNIVVGECRSNSLGDWSYDLTLDSLQNYEEYPLFCEIEIPSGVTVQTETKMILYDEDCPIVNSVTMINTAHAAGSLRLCNYETIFSFNGQQELKPYWYSYPEFTFIANISSGDYNEITSVTIYVLTEKGEWIPLKAIFDENTNGWVSVNNFYSGNLPINVGVNYNYITSKQSDERFATIISNSVLGNIEIGDSSSVLDYSLTEDNDTILLTYDGNENVDLLPDKVYIENQDICMSYVYQNVNHKLTLSIYGVDSIPTSAEWFEVNDMSSFYMNTNSSDVSVVCELYYPISFINNLLLTPSAQENSYFDFLSLLKDKANGENNVCVSLRLERDIQINDDSRRKSLLDDALANCPELEPIIDRMRRRADHSRRMNNNLNEFRRPLDYIQRVLGRGGPLAQSAGAGIGVGDQAVGFGQEAGNYINGLADRNDMAALEAAGCLPPNNPPIPPHINPHNNASYVMDPSGFVFEAVPDNRVEGVQASIYYKETKEDMYGDPYEEIVLWNAEDYAQKNPLFTDENGMYQWDVPQGLWQVKFEKDGYVTAYSDWLPVPPPQLEVNIGIVQNKQPEVTEARAYEEGVEVQFDKYMDLSTLTASNIYVTANGEKLNGEIRFVNSALADEYADEDDADATRYASRIRFVPEEKLSATTGEIRVTVSRNVLSYAGIPMTETFTQVLDVEKEVQTIYADDVKVLYGGEKEVTVYALPFDAAVGRKLHIANSSDMIASIDITEATLDDEGKAVVVVKGDLPGRAQLTFTIDDVTATGECAVDVVTEIITAEAPKSSRASGTAVYRGTKIVLTTESKDGVIYFTTDGSCPCDENGTRRKYTVPIIINDDTQILAMTSVGNGDDDVSETVQFNYTLKRSDMDFQMPEGWTWMSHSFETNIAPDDLAADENIARILSQTKEVIRDPQLGMIGTLTELSASESYKVETTASTTRQRLSDVAWNPATPIALNAGWNWLGYPVGQTMSVDEAFAPTNAEALDVVVGQNGFAQFDGENWIGTLETMSPGMGYMYQSQSAKNVVYNTSIVSTASAKYVPGISANSPLVLDIHKYGVIMPVVATIRNVDGTQLDNKDYQVAAFCGSECRGIGRVVNGLVMMNVYGKVNDQITFLVTDAEGENSFANNASLNFSEKVVGDLFAPYEIAINRQSGISDVKYGGNVKVAVDGDMLRIKGIAADKISFVEVYDINGHKLIHETNVSESGIRISTLTDGVYVVIVNGNGEYTYHKIAVR